ncbi:MAG: D-fructose-6-phosphate amidotransferase [Flavobacteriaceae bacterium]|nr:MAG: D-fructose-6-phosphate amidotransferase [Flavobacteriaceae bacterium]
MPALIIAEIEIHDLAQYENYKKLTPATIAAYDGKFVVRGAEAETLEGDWQAKRIVVLEFPSVARAKEWWNSDAYAAPKALRHKISTGKMIVVQSV